MSKERDAGIAWLEQRAEQLAEDEEASGKEEQ